MTSNDPIPILCRYRLKPGAESEFAELLQQHWPLLHRLGLVTEAPAKVQRAGDKAGNVAFIEEFAWKDAQAPQSAHESVDVMRHWEPMGALCEDMEFWEVTTPAFAAP